MLKEGKILKTLAGIIFGVLFASMVHAQEIAYPPEQKVSEAIQLSEPQSLQQLNSELYEAIQKQRAEDALSIQSGSWWQDTATGPYPTVGGTWYAGGEMRATYVPPGSIMQTLQYYWDNSHLNGWNSQVTVLLYVTDGYTAYSADVTSNNSATLNASGIPASYSVYILMKVGNLQVSLYNPPYIPYTSASVYYTY